MAPQVGILLATRVRALIRERKVRADSRVAIQLSLVAAREPNRRTQKSTLRISPAALDIFAAQPVCAISVAPETIVTTAD
jgi:hypothetical protein